MSQRCTSERTARHRKGSLLPASVFTVDVASPGFTHNFHATCVFLSPLFFIAGKAVQPSDHRDHRRCRTVADMRRD